MIRCCVLGVSRYSNICCRSSTGRARSDGIGVCVSMIVGLSCGTNLAGLQRSGN